MAVLIEDDLILGAVNKLVLVVYHQILGEIVL